MYRFFCEKSQIADGKVKITGEDVRHIRNVLRMRPGEVILVSCGDEWEYTCRILSLSEEEVCAEIADAQKPGKELPSRITLLQCLPKGDKMETVIQKAVELGAAEIVPVASKRCVVKLDAKKAPARVARWNAIAESAAKQAKRMIIPEVHEVLSFREALQYAQNAGGEMQAHECPETGMKLENSGEHGKPVLLIPYENAEGMQKTRKLLSSIVPGQPVAVLIGPEGGFDESEVQAAEDAGFHSITLGKRILRTETAGMTALSILMYLLES